MPPKFAGKCKRCQAMINFAMTGLGKLAPFDAQPTPDGGWWLTLKPTGDLVAVVAPKGEDPKRNRYVSHFSSCPNASEFRRK